MRRGRRRGLSLLLALVLLLGLLPGTAWAAGETPMGHVKFSVETKTIDGNCLILPMEEELYMGDTVYTILSRVAAEQGLLVEGADTGYVTRIGEFGSYPDSDYGSESGWMVLLNNDYNTWPLPALKDGDSVRFCYTYKTYGHDIDLIDLVGKLEEKAELASSYTGENENAVCAAYEEAYNKLQQIAGHRSNQEYINSLGTMVYGAGSDAEKLKVLINKLDVTLAGNEYVPTQNVEIQVLDINSKQAVTEYVAGRSYQLRAVFEPDNASWQQGQWKLITGMGADATVTEDGVLTITGVNDELSGVHMLTVQFWHPEASGGCFIKPLSGIKAPQTEQDHVNVAQNQLTWDSIKGDNLYSYAVTSNFSVPTQLEIEGKMVEVSCTSDDSTGALSAYKNGAGTAWDIYVSRPAAQDVSCNLNVTLSCGEAKATMQFPITVKAEGVNEDKTSVVVYGDLMSGIASGYTAATEAWTVLDMTAYNGAKLSANSGTDLAKALVAAAQGNVSVPDTISKHDYTNEPWNIPYALMVYDAVGADTSEFANTREQLKSSLITQLNGAGDGTDVEDVVPALAALSTYYGKEDTALDQAVDKGISWLSAHQNSDGTFSTYGTSNANTTALAVVALSALGIDAHTDNRFIKNNKSALEGLFSFALSDNTGFGYKGNVTLDTLATEQGFRALVAYARMKDNNKPYNIYLEAKDSTGVVPAPDITATGKPGEGGGSGEDPQKTVTVTISVMVPPKGGAEGQYTYRHDSALYTNLLGGSQKMTVASGTTALSVLKSALDGAGISYQADNTGYVTSIGGLAAFDHGPRAGWKYAVNGTAPQESSASYTFTKNSTLIWYYTDDYTKETDDSWSGGKPEQPAEEQPAQVVGGQDGSYQVTLPEDSTGPVRVTIPDVSGGDLLVIVHSDGTQEVVKKSMIQDGTAYLMLEEDAAVKVVDYASGFTDVAEDAWYAGAVDFTAGRGLFSGVGEGSFAPDDTLSRGMVVTVLYALEEPGAQKTEDLFSDVPGDAWYAQGTAWAVEAGIVSGYGDGQFGPNDAITREQLALMLYRYAQSLKLDVADGASLTAFGDGEQVPSWARQAMAWAVGAGIMGGTPEGNLNPGGTATRAEAAVMVSQFVAWMLKSA